jgi:hypothetical protein
MKFFTGSLVAGLVLLAGSAQAQGPGRYMAASDVETPYVVGPRVVIPPPYEAGPRYGYGPSLLPSTEVYAVLRDNGFSPLGIPRLRGFVYTIAALDRDGSGGRLVIDARDGRILRFVPRRWGSDNFYEEQSMLRAPLPGPVAPPRAPTPQAQAPQAEPHQAQAHQAQPPQAHGAEQSAVRPSRPQVATRTVPMPKASPIAAKPAPAAPAPVQQAAAPAPKSAEAQAAAPAATDAVAAKPAPLIAPTEDMPKAQGLE